MSPPSLLRVFKFWKRGAIVRLAFTINVTLQEDRFSDSMQCNTQLWPIKFKTRFLLPTTSAIYRRVAKPFHDDCFPKTATRCRFKHF